MSYINIDQINIADEHICCAFSDKKCAESYALKKEWMTKEFEKGFYFKRLDQRAKVFIEYGPAENFWIPVTAPKTLMLGCFWVSGKYKGTGHGKALLNEAKEHALSQGMSAIVAVTGKKKFHFMSDGKWLTGQGFEEVDSTPSGFSLLALPLNEDYNPQNYHFNPEAKKGQSSLKEGYTVYYSNRCPYTEYHVNVSLAETSAKKNISFNVVKIDSLEKAKTAPTPATIFSLFKDGEFLTTDLSVCMESRFDKITGRK